MADLFREWWATALSFPGHKDMRGAVIPAPVKGTALGVMGDPFTPLRSENQAM